MPERIEGGQWSAEFYNRNTDTRKRRKRPTSETWNADVWRKRSGRKNGCKAKTRWR